MTFLLSYQYNQADLSEWVGKSDQADLSDQIDKAEQTDLPDQVDKSGHTTRQSGPTRVAPGDETHPPPALGRMALETAFSYWDFGPSKCCF